MSDDEVAQLDDYSSLLEDEDEGEDDSFGDLELNKYQQKVIKNIAEPYIKKIMRQTGKNFAKVGLEFLTKGPGLTNFNFFDGVLDIVKEALKLDFIDRIGEIYEKDFRFRKAYSAIMNQWSSKKVNVDEELVSIAENYDNASDQEKTLLRNTLNMVAILLSDKYSRIITRELDSFYSYSKVPELLKKLANDLNIKIDTSKDVTKQAANILLEFYEKYRILESDLRPVSNLYFMVSSAISLSTFKGISYREPVEKEVLRINRYIINRREFLENTRNNNNSRVISKYSKYLGDRSTREAFFELVDTIEKDFNDKLKVQESLMNLEQEIRNKVGDKETGYPELDSARNAKKILSIFYGIN